MPNSNVIPTLFGGEKASIVADSPDFLNECSILGFNTLGLKNIKTLPKNSIVFSFSHEAAKHTFELAKNTEIKRSIFCAAQVFDPSVANALYSLRLLLKSDFEQALKTQRAVLNMLNSHSTFNLSGNDASAETTISKHASPYALIEEDIAGNFVHSVAEFFEVHYAHMKPQEPCPFKFNGALKISGILTVLRRTNPALSEDLKASLQSLTQLIAEEKALLTVENNIITSFKTKNLEHINLLELAAGPRGLNLTEFAIGVNDSISSTINYQVNSQMNEGISGVHLAIGDGSSGYHIDFLSPGVNVTPIAQQLP
ncbi:hypothetical protein [Pseudomonas fluorescens]|uniref:Crocagin biosynthetic protein CgnE/B domain-containing protein n=1 Tax=Pseudomonas fluorescens TaxID=294 RepID=A0A5E7FJ93_PSEFL|nr:hypothetical protein [Pseudomonas fluorescens]VVO37283.1 hypothetical protein PS691_05422 [Pseudomonas fluorescens]